MTLDRLRKANEPEEQFVNEIQDRISKIESDLNDKQVWACVCFIVVSSMLLIVLKEEMSNAFAAAEKMEYEYNKHVQAKAALNPKVCRASTMHSLYSFAHFQHDV